MFSKNKLFSTRKTQVGIKLNKLKIQITEKSTSLKGVLTQYQPQEVTDYEIERSIRTLSRLIDHPEHLLDERSISSAAILLPSNLPLYSLVVFAIIPALLAKVVYVRPNTILQEIDVITKISDQLNLFELFPGIKIINESHAGFVPYIKEADLLVFTGKPANASKFLPVMKPNAVMIVNGAGHNPLVITETADLEKAVKDSLHVKAFNGGQDCAGPDAILVHASIAAKFIEKFTEKFSSLKVGTFDDRSVTIGPIHRFDELHRLAGILHANKKDISSGGQVDYRTGIVYPAVIVRDIDKSPNYAEMYGPIAFIHPYSSESALASYFQDDNGQYNANRMYVSVYGRSNFVETHDDALRPGKPGNIGIVLHDQTIHDDEIGYKPYGGYSMGASGVIKKTERGIVSHAMPILIPEIIVKYILDNKDLSLETKPELISPREKKVDPLVKDFHAIASKVFDNNLHFGFIFGSAAKGQLKITDTYKSDLDTFICLKREDKAQEQVYLKALRDLHEKFNLKVDEVFPTELMTKDALETASDNLDTMNVDLNEVLSGKKYDYIFWGCVLTDKKIGVLGDAKNGLFPFIKKFEPHVKRWSQQILDQIEKLDVLPEKIIESFPELDKKLILQKLKKLAPREVIQHCLNVDNSFSSKKIFSIKKPKIGRLGIFRCMSASNTAFKEEVRPIKALQI